MRLHITLSCIQRSYRLEIAFRERVKGCNFAIISHVHNLLCVHVCVIYT